jgi:predicted outer membrane repeat protein
MTVSVSNTFFFNNTAVDNGGAFYQLGNISLVIEGSIFLKNKAKTGGVLLIDCEYFSECKVNITNTKLDQNFAEIAPTIMSKTRLTFLTNSSLTNNTDYTGFANDSISHFPLNIVVLGDLLSQNGETEEDATRRLIRENINEHMWETPQIVTSGKEFNTTLTLIDAQFNYLVFDDYSRASLSHDFNNTSQEDINANASAKNTTNSSANNSIDSSANSSAKDFAKNSTNDLVIESGQATSSKGLFKFNNVKIITNPNTTIFLKITINCERTLFFISSPPNSELYSDKYDGTLTFEARLKLFVRPCLKGEILKPDYSCYFCQEGKKLCL